MSEEKKPEEDRKPDPPTELDPSGSMPLAAEEGGEEDEETIAGRAWRRATTIGPVMVDVAKDVAYALGPTSPYHRHDFIVIALAAVVVAAAAFGHRRMVEPSVEVFETRGLRFERPATWLAPEEVAPVTPRLIAAEPPKPKDPNAELPYHVVYTSTLDPDVRMEVRIEAAPTWRNIIAGLELDRRTRWGELYGADTSRVRTIAGHDWLRTRFRYAYAPEKGDEPRIGSAVELATVDRERLYVLTIYGSPRRVTKLEDQIAPTLHVASHTGMPLVPQSSRLQPAYPASVARTFSSTVMVMVADVVDGRLRAVGGGSGVIVGADGSILTNHHVLDRDETKLHDLFVIGRFVAIDQPPRLVCAGHPSASKLQPDVDLALLKCDMDLDGRPWSPAAGGPIWPALVGAPRTDLSPGQRLWVLGYPDVGGGSLTILQGLVEGFTSEDGTLGKDYIKTDAALSHGNSGGPVVDDAGDLVGIATAQRRRIGNNGTMIKDGLVRPLAAAGTLLGIVRAGWAPREGRTSVEIEPTAIDAEAEGIRISTRVVDSANDQPIPGALVMVLRPGVSAAQVDVNRLDDMVIAWGRSGTSGEVFLKQPVPAPGTYTVMVVVDGYTPLIGSDALHLGDDTPAYFDPWGEVRLEAE
jgi:S1-C subfamily serine protease